jgi:hypothetical protein
MDTRLAGACAVTGGALTAISGILVQTVVMPGSDVPDDQWSYPWSASALVPVSAVYATFHVLIFLALLGLAGSGLAGRAGPRLALIGTALLFVGELASIPIAGQTIDRPGPSLVGALFGVGTLISAIGFLVAGTAAVRAGRWHGWTRWTPLATGVVLLAVTGLAMTPALPAGVAAYGIGVVLIGLGLRSEAITPRYVATGR